MKNKHKNKKLFISILLMGSMLVNYFTIEIYAKKPDSTVTKTSLSVNKKINTKQDSPDVDLASGTHGTSDWIIDAEGVLHIYSGMLPNFSAGVTNPSWYDYSSSVKKIVIEGEVVAGTRLDYFFAYMTNLTQIENLHLLNTDATTTMNGTFQHLRELKQIDVSGLNTAKITSFSAIFAGSTSLTSLDISNWDLTNIVVGSESALPPNLTHIILGKKTVLRNTRLTQPPNDGIYSWTWINRETKTTYDRETLTKTYDGNTMAGEYMWTKIPKLNLRDVILYIDESWSFQDNFISGSDMVGDEIFSLNDDIKVIGDQDVDVSKPGVYEVEYRYYYNNGTNYSISKSKVTVKDNQTAVNVHDSTIYIGDSWTAQDNFDSALDKDGNAVDFKDITVDDSKMDTDTTGTYVVTYSYDGITSTASITVKDKMTAVNVHDSTIYVGDSWTAQDNFDSALDKDGNAVDFKDIIVSGDTVDSNIAGTYKVTYSYSGIDKTASIVVKARTSGSTETNNNTDGASHNKNGNDDKANNNLSQTGDIQLIIGLTGLFISSLALIIILATKNMRTKPQKDSKKFL